MEKEIWKEIEGYEDYLISTHGRVKSFMQYKEGKILKKVKDTFGYMIVCMTKNRKTKNFKIHRLLAKEFIQNSNIEEFIQVNHIDEDKTNNYIDNLEWCSPQYNTEYSQAKKYKILFPDGHKEIIFNMNKFCKENDLSVGDINSSFTKGWIHKGHRILEIIEKDGTVRKAKKRKKYFYRVSCPNKQEIITDNLTKFCKKNNICRFRLKKTIFTDIRYEGYKLLESINKNGVRLVCPTYEKEI